MMPQGEDGESFGGVVESRTWATLTCMEPSAPFVATGVVTARVAYAVAAGSCCTTEDPTLPDVPLTRTSLPASAASSRLSTYSCGTMPDLAPAARMLSTGLSPAALTGIRTASLPTSAIGTSPRVGRP